VVVYELRRERVKACGVQALGDSPGEALALLEHPEDILQV
jgi:hypothetical protein